MMYKLYGAVLAFLGLTSQVSSSDPLNHHLESEGAPMLRLHSAIVGVDTHPKNWKNSEIPTLLKQGKVISLCPMKEYLQSCGKRIEYEGNVFLVKLDNGLKAVFKSVPEDEIGDAYAEVAAYQASVVFGFPNVPPTIISQINSMKGSLQLFVETPIDSLKPGVYESALKEASPEDVANLKFFYFVFGQWDTGEHNIVILKNQEKTLLIAIDNSGICNHQHVKYGSLPFVQTRYSDALNTDDWDSPFPFEQAKTIEYPTTEKLQKTFGDAFPESFYQYVDKFYQSDKFRDLPFRYVIYRNCLWWQYNAEDTKFILSFTSNLPDLTREKLKALDLTLLNKIFEDAQGNEFLTQVYLEAILERRDQVLRYFDGELQ